MSIAPEESEDLVVESRIRFSGPNHAMAELSHLLGDRREAPAKKLVKSYGGMSGQATSGSAGGCQGMKIRLASSQPDAVDGGRSESYRQKFPAWFFPVANAPWSFRRMKNNKAPWYQLKDSETKWYHHLMHGRVLIMLVLIAIVCFLAIGVGIYSAFF